MMHGAPRWPALILLPALLIGIVLLDRRDEPDPGAVIDTRSAMPVAPSTSRIAAEAGEAPGIP